jgi:3-hydroxyisobutyrate dehydrogenase-like beta-hydroxyacid dehydrogenase
VKVAFLGLGIMGSRMAANLLRAGHELSVWNRSQGKAQELVRRGARLAATPAEAAAGAEILFTMLANPEAVSDTALGKNGFLDFLSRSALWVDCSTVTPGASRRMSREAAARGVDFLDAPVVGSLPAAEKAELTFLVGGEEDDLERCRPLLSVMGKATKRMGPVGMGSSMKLLNNMLLGSAMAAFSEALAFGGAMGFARSALLDALLGTGVTAPFLASKRQKLEKVAFEAEFPLRLMLKDLQLVSDAAYELCVPLPTTHAAKELFGLAAANGLADVDFSGVSEVLRKKGGDTT